MNKKKTILVTGATGAQGGSVAWVLLGQDKFKVRVLTRDTSSPKAIELERAGAELVYGDLNKPDTLVNAMQDCYGVYGVTNYWEHYDKEFQQGRNLVNAVKKTDIKHFVLHTLPSYSILSEGKYPTPHCDIKAQLQLYTISQSIPATFLQVAFYYENFLNYFPLIRHDDGSYHFGFPQGDTRLAMVSVEDVGGMVAAIFDHPKEYTGRVVGAVGADETCETYAAILSNVLGKAVCYDYIPREQYAGFGFPGAEELANMFEVQRLHIKGRQLDLIESYALNPAMQSFVGWVSKHKYQFLAAMNNGEQVLI
ncbi:NmrA/HSCARG family protein [Flavihumibacter fluvii]|uniref:NmrA/HSCARG family protein n=1 Tax=Flavihumibacter fluvii TaxID=2838157 RepID=UPI001BDED8C7|nr:NmrA/HSCARG family protein [Flavihumibacter fluvii]ULQ53164.1 NmrA/HSCARG family protein [Flavihumibacter fluvii]